MLDFKIEGLKELDKVLSDLPKAVAKNQLKAALRRAAKPLLADAKALAPKRTGAMAKSIKISPVTRSRVPSITIGPDPEHWYGYLQERGTRNHPAQPFLRPAWDRNRERIANELPQHLWYVLERMAKRLKKQAYAGKLSRAGRKALGL